MSSKKLKTIIHFLRHNHQSHRKVLLKSFRPDTFTLGFHPQTETLEPLCAGQHHRKVLLSSFYLNGHTLGFHPRTQRLEPPCTAQ